MARERYGAIETVHVPSHVVDLADRRTEAFIRASVNYPDALRQMVRSAYMQGLEDGWHARDQSVEVQRPASQEGR